jgi:hypothetical protein
MRPSTRILASAGALMAVSLLAAVEPAAAKTLHRYHPNVAYGYHPQVYSSDQPPLTVNRRSWLDPGNVVPQGTADRYVAASTTFEQTPDQIYFPSRFHEDVLPQPLYPTGRPSPVVEFWTPVYPYP